MRVSLSGIWRLWCLGLCLSATAVQAQHVAARVHLRDKPVNLAQPPADLSEACLARRAAQGLPLWDASDYPVHAPYLQQVEGVADTVLFASRWFNHIAVLATESQLQVLASLPCVLRVERVYTPLEATLAGIPQQPEVLAGPGGAYPPESYRQYQMLRMGEPTFAAKGIRGQGIIVAIFDAGFTGVPTDPVFAHLQPRILEVWDFVGKDNDPYHGATHGTTVLACVAGKTADGPVGLATEASFLLARTEMSKREPFREELFWQEAMEWADRKGAQVINSSLGYNKPRYTPGDMDGQKSYVSKAANMAARKGILVVNSAGNEGNDSWKYIITPADADSVLAVGGTNPHTDTRIGFSSYGPTADGRLKPEVCAPGMAAGTNGSGKGLSIHYGTSFASPLVAGFAACARQLYPSLSVMELKARIEQAGHLHPYFDYAHGYGVPTAEKLLAEVVAPAATFEVVQMVEKDTANADDEPYAVLEVTLQVANPQQEKTQHIFYHVADPQGHLKYYGVARQPAGKTSTEAPRMVIHLPLTDTEGNDRIGLEDTIRIHYEGYTYAFTR
jgi:subtilisin family serine protease